MSKNNDGGSTPPAAAPPAAPQALSKEMILAALAGLTPAEKRALGFSTPAPQYAGTPKLSTAINAIPSEERAAVVKACAAALKVQADPAALGASFSELQQRWPELGIAISTNSNYRQKPLGHSLRVVVEALSRKDA